MIPLYGVQVLQLGAGDNPNTLSRTHDTHFDTSGIRIPQT